MRVFLSFLVSLVLTSAAFSNPSITRTGGTNDNPVMTATVSLQQALQSPVSISLGRGRTLVTRVEMRGTSVAFSTQLRNSHRTRGWTLQNDIQLIDRNGRHLASITQQGGINARPFSRTRTRNLGPEIVNDVHGQIAYLVITSKRNPSGRLEPLEQALKRAAAQAAAAYLGLPISF